MYDKKNWTSLKLVCLLPVLLAGCAQMSMTPPQPTIENVAKMRNGTFAPTGLGNFQLAENVDPGVDKGISIRTNDLRSPVDSSFAQYLRETLKVELQSAGLFDPKSSTVIAATLTDSRLSANVGTGHATLAARFVVAKAGQSQYDRELRVDTTWESPFMGVSAIPLAAGQYEALYRKMVATLLDDIDFRRVMRKD